MIQWLTDKDRMILDTAPGETRLQKMKFVVAFYGAALAAQTARLVHEKDMEESNKRLTEKTDEQ